MFHNSRLSGMSLRGGRMLGASARSRRCLFRCADNALSRGRLDDPPPGATPVGVARDAVSQVSGDPAGADRVVVAAACGGAGSLGKRRYTRCRSRPILCQLLGVRKPCSPRNADSQLGGCEFRGFRNPLYYMRQLNFPARIDQASDQPTSD